ncbi:MAG: gamma-glutamyltransferase [bacterium]
MIAFLRGRGWWYCRLWVLPAVVGVLSGCAGLEVSRYYERGALATAAPIATAVGENVFRQGGNAFDAAVAVGFALAVVHPQAGNIGGGGFALVRAGESGDVRALDFRETAPGQATETMYLDKQGEVISEASTLGAGACGVPGTVAGLYGLWQAYGSLPWEQLLGPAASLADTGFLIDDYLASSLARYQDRLSIYQETARVFFPDGRCPQSGERLMQKDLAATLYAIAAAGPRGFYEGPVGRNIVACMEAHGGLITASDLKSYRPIWRQPIRFGFDSLEIYSMPPPSSGGIAVGQILKLLETHDFSVLTPGSPEYIHLFCEAARLAFADRSVHLGDPGFYDVPEGLLDSVYIHDRRSLIKKEHARSSELVSAGNPRGTESSETTHFSVCDVAGNMVAVTYTLNTGYGCKLLVEGAGFLLNNEMDDFSIKPGYPNTYGLVGGEANKIEPGKRMLSSMSPTLVLKKGRPFMILGAPGGSRIITVVAQAILNLTRFGFSLQAVVSQPRFHHQWLPDRIDLELGGFDINTTQELIRYGHAVRECESYSDLQAIIIDDSGLMAAASDPRGRGVAGGL